MKNQAHVEARESRESPGESAFFPDEVEEPTASQGESTQAMQEVGEPDVLIETPEVDIERISIQADELRTGVSLFARVGNFVALEIGANAQLGNVSLKMRGVRARGKVKVQLQKVYAILLRALESIDRKPELLGAIDRPAPQLGATVGKETRLSERAEAGEKAAAPAGKVAEPAERGVDETVGKATAPVGKAVSGTAEKTRQAAGKTTEKATGTLKKAVPSIEHAAGGVAAKTKDATSGVAEKTKDATSGVAAKTKDAASGIKQAAEGDGRNDRTERVMRPIKHAAHEVADKARLVYTMAKVAATTHRASRAPRRAAKAAGHATQRVVHPGVPRRKSR